MSTKVQETIKEISGLSTHEAQRVIDLKTLESIEKLNDGIENLNSTIKISNNQSEKLEKSNIKLQIVMLVLTAITTVIGVYPLLNKLTIDVIIPLLSQSTNIVFSTSLVVYMTSLISILTGFIMFYTEKKIIKDKILIIDSLKLVLIDKNGKIKEKRSSK